MSRGRLITIALVVFTLLGFVFLRGPTPHITIKPETITSAGPVDFTNTMITSWFVVAFMIIAVFLASLRWELVPRGAQNVLEAQLRAGQLHLVGEGTPRDVNRGSPTELHE